MVSTVTFLVTTDTIQEIREILTEGGVLTFVITLLIWTKFLHKVIINL